MTNDDFLIQEGSFDFPLSDDECFLSYSFSSSGELTAEPVVSAGTDFPAAANPNYLLSTLWSQSGVIKLGNNTTVTYNQYTPVDQWTGKHSVTGCTNTAAGQIIYYAIEKQGLALQLTLESSDAYISQHSSGLNISIKADGSTPGTVSFAAVNSKLAKYDLNSADDAAALLYACGVVQQAEYSSSSDGTSTAWSEELFYRAGFSSVLCSRYYVTSGNDYWVRKFYYWGSYTYKNGQYTYTISDDAWEVVIENLQAKRVVGLTLPGHAVVIDGYDAATGKFHINYGWGEYSSGTGWYSRSQLHTMQVKEFVYDIMVTGVKELSVTDSALYGSGTLIRAIEQAGGIKGKNKITFSHTVDGKNLNLSDALSLYEAVTIDNFNMNISVTDTLSSWGQGIIAEKESTVKIRNFSGALIADTALSTNAAFYAYDADALSVRLDGGLVFAGTYAVTGDLSAGARQILSSMQSCSLGGGSLTEYVVDASEKHYAFYGSSGDDLFLLDNSSVTAGKILMGEGDDTLEVLGGSQLYGAIMGAETITIDSSSSVTGVIYDHCSLNLLLKGKASDRGLFKLQDNAYYLSAYADSVTVDISGAETGTYTLFSGDNSVQYMDSLKNLTLTVTDSKGQSADLTAGSTGQSWGNVRLFYEDRALKLQLTAVPEPTALKGGASQLSWTGVAGTEEYDVALSSEEGLCCFSVRGDTVDLYGLPEGSWQWGVRESGKVTYVEGKKITSNNDPESAQRYKSVLNAKEDLFFAQASGVWGKGYEAKHTGMQGWEGTGEKFSLKGKNCFQDIYNGSLDHAVLMLTDDPCGDALFADDIYSPSPSAVDEVRLSGINKIYAGAGDDIIDLTVANFQKTQQEGVEIHGGDGNDVIWADTGTNHLYGDAGDDRIVGGTSADAICGGSGNDRMHGGGGADTFFFCEEWGEDIVEQLSSGSVTLWFAEGDESCWDPVKRLYSDGLNTVTVLGECKVYLTFKAAAAPDLLAEASSSVIYQS